MNALIPRLRVSVAEPLGFGPSLEIRAFLLQLEQGNLLVYRAATLEREKTMIAQHGGISRQYVNHWHEASPACDWVRDTFDSPLSCHVDDAQSVSRACTVDETFSQRHWLDDDFEIIPTPGHTSGATAFLWDSGEHRCLFCGDTIFLPRGKWVAAVLEGTSARARYLDFDLIVPSVAASGQPYYEFVDRPEAQHRIDAIIERVQRGEDG